MLFQRYEGIYRRICKIMCKRFLIILKKKMQCFWILFIQYLSSSFSYTKTYSHLLVVNVYSQQDRIKTIWYFLLLAHICVLHDANAKHTVLYLPHFNFWNQFQTKNITLGCMYHNTHFTTLKCWILENLENSNFWNETKIWISLWFWGQ